MKMGVEWKREVLEGSCPDWILSPPVCLNHSHPPALPPGLDFPFNKGERVGLLNSAHPINPRIIWFLEPPKQRLCQERVGPGVRGHVWGLLASVDQRIHYPGSDHTQLDTTLPSLFSPLKLKEDRIVSAIDRGRKQVQSNWPEIN